MTYCKLSESDRGEFQVRDPPGRCPVLRSIVVSLSLSLSLIFLSDRGATVQFCFPGEEKGENPAILGIGGVLAVARERGRG